LATPFDEPAFRKASEEILSRISNDAIYQGYLSTMNSKQEMLIGSTKILAEASFERTVPSRFS